MSNPSRTNELLKRIFRINNYTLILLLLVFLSIIVLVVYVTQSMVEQDAFKITTGIPADEAKRQYELAKLAAEIRQIRSDTSGSLFWLKMIALLVTVGGAVGGYLVGQSTTAQKRINFEKRKEVDTLYQSIVQELSAQSPLLRAAAAVKLGMILKSFPAEWNEEASRQEQIIQLTKQILAACLSIESDEKVLKTLSIALISHQPWNNEQADSPKKEYADARKIDLSGAKAAYAYWARVDFTNADFFRANLHRASLRKSTLRGAQFRETNLSEAVLSGSDCKGANFKLCDLREADLREASLIGASFEGAKVHGVKLDGANLQGVQAGMVDVSPDAGTVMLISVSDWLSLHLQTPSASS